MLFKPFSGRSAPGCRRPSPRERAATAAVAAAAVPRRLLAVSPPRLIPTTRPRDLVVDVEALRHCLRCRLRVQPYVPPTQPCSRRWGIKALLAVSPPRPTLRPAHITCNTFHLGIVIFKPDRFCSFVFQPRIQASTIAKFFSCFFR